MHLTGSWAISEYIARASGHAELVGGLHDAARIATAQMWYDHTRDLGSQWTRVCYPGPMERVFNLAQVTCVFACVVDGGRWLTQNWNRLRYTDKSWDPVCKRLRETGKFLGGDGPILADFVAAEIIFALLCCDEERMLGGAGSEFQDTLRRFLTRMLNLRGQERAAVSAIEAGWTFNNGNACNPQFANLALLLDLVNAKYDE